MTTVTLHNLSFTYGPGQAALHGIHLTLISGELMALLGPSGSGKSTTLRLIAGLLQPDQGDIRFDDRSVVSLPAEKRGAVMVFQEHALFPFMRVADNVAFGLKLRRLDRKHIRRRVAEALESVQLAGFEERWPDELSGGQRQRVALARALVVRPRLLLLDEPLSNLEPRLRAELRGMVRTLQQEAGITTLFVTHDQAEAVDVADRIALLMEGRIRQVGPARDFYERPADLQVARFFGGVNVLPGVKHGSVVETPLGELAVSTSDRPDGAVLVTIRPEAIELGANGFNNLVGSVESYSYHGLIAHCGADINNARLQVTVPPYRRFRTGEKIVLHLPPERIHLLPPEEAL